MGRYSDSEDDRRKKKSKRRSRSRSTDSRDNRRKKKRKTRRRSRSRSYSPRRRRSRSRSRGRRSRSDSRERRRSRRSRSRDRRSRSRDRRSRERRSRSASYRRSSDSPAEMKLTAGEKKRPEVVVPPAPAKPEAGLGLTAEETQRRADAIEQIDADGFVAADFSSSRGQTLRQSGTKYSLDNAHDAAMFGGEAAGSDILTSQRKTIHRVTGKALLGKAFYAPYEGKLADWARKWTEYRRGKRTFDNGVNNS